MLLPKPGAHWVCVRAVGIFGITEKVSTAVAVEQP